VSLLAIAAALALQPPQGTLRLDCGLADDGENASAGTTRLTITLDMGARGIDSVDVEGPPLFSSRQGLVVFDAYPNGRMTSSSPSRRQLRWTGRLDGATIALSRQNSRIALAPDAASEGGWRGTYDLGQIQMGDMTAEGPSGAIVCRRTAS
jgi:hypothetical protein